MACVLVVSESWTRFQGPLAQVYPSLGGEAEAQREEWLSRGPTAGQGRAGLGLWSLCCPLTEPSCAKLGASELNRSDFCPAGFTVSDRHQDSPGVTICLSRWGCVNTTAGQTSGGDGERGSWESVSLDTKAELNSAAFWPTWKSFMDAVKFLKEEGAARLLSIGGGRVWWRGSAREGGCGGLGGALKADH